ncbi:uncharacterized protein [Zea mays]|uniref:uncharacterized protein isoform X4 n=1 Tax=Zea mays TaxID=4577 RepID=UPI0009AAB301|nr:uncharacterized protein LOC103643333 isoform X4 [Zea mays]|eukprot:XP_020402298.1 uncharacterized protein LOC103643333 isoform X4 [Zea mays]
MATLAPPAVEVEPEADAMALASEAAAPELPSSHSQLDFFKTRVQLLCESNTRDFDAWVSLINAAEGTSADDIEVMSLVYHNFLLEFPLCYGYWIKYAAHKARLCTTRYVMDVYEQAVHAVPHSVDIWVNYCEFGICAFEEPAHVRSLFERALSLVGKDYLCYHLWDKYIEFESSQKQLIHLATIFINTLKFPTKKLHMYYESFRKFVTLLEQEVTSCVAEILSEKVHASEMVGTEGSELDISTIIADLFDQKGGHLSPEALKHYLSAGEKLYKMSSKIYKEICYFEASIKRPFFNVKTLDDDQLENWHQYLDFVEKNGDFDWAVKLYERCLIPCANYSEFWIRYSEYVDAKGGREIANHALGRASSCFAKASHSIIQAKQVFVDGINRAPCKPLIKGFIQFMSTHGGPKDIPLLDSVISNAVTPGSDVSTALSREDREDISLLFLEFVDLYGGIKELRKAWARHSILFPHSTGNISRHYSTMGNSLQETKKRRNTEPLMIARDHSLEDTMKLKQTLKTDDFSLIVDKESEPQVDKDIVDSGKRHGDAGAQKALDLVNSHKETITTAQECTDMVYSEHILDKNRIEKQMNSHAKEDINQDLILHEQNDEKTNSHEAETPVAESGDCDSPSKAIASSENINFQGKVIEVSASSHLETVCSKYDSPSGPNMHKEGSSSGPARISPELEERHHVEVQVKVDTEHHFSVSNANLEISFDGPNPTECDKEISAIGHGSQDYIQSSQSHQLSACAKPWSLDSAKTKSDTVSIQAQLRNQLENAQTYQSNNLSQNMQQQELTMPHNVQTSAQIQDQLLAQPNHRNQQYLQMMQGYATQMGEYYQQQLYYLQAQHNQQMQSLQQQQLPTEHLQQTFMQQVQQLNQQLVLWQQQVQQQPQVVLQQALPVQQLPDEKQGQCPSGDSKHGQNKQQQQAPQMDQQSQQLQQQQLLYLQQQQQMYLIQQQQMYQQQQAQQQQLLQQQLMQQQQYVLQMPQHQQDSVRQQQQQLFEQQQQQMMLLQRQQQHIMQQQIQPYVQQQQNQQGPKDQTYKSNHQDGRNRQMEHGQLSEASQSDGSKLRSGEQSELSYPSTPQSERSNH